jgi:hypothetical protein
MGRHTELPWLLSQVVGSAWMTRETRERFAGRTARTMGSSQRCRATTLQTAHRSSMACVPVQMGLMGQTSPTTIAAIKTLSCPLSRGTEPTVYGMRGTVCTTRSTRPSLFAQHALILAVTAMVRATVGKGPRAEEGTSELMPSVTRRRLVTARLRSCGAMGRCRDQRGADASSMSMSTLCTNQLAIRPTLSNCATLAQAEANRHPS